MTMKPLIVGLALLLAGPVVAADADTAAYDVVIRETAFGIPHIQADDMASLGFGAGYAYAAKNVCLLADALVTVRGERSMAFGPEAMVDLVGGPTRNLDSDVFFRAYLDDDRIAAGYAAGDADAVALIDGYAAGYNHYLAERGAGGLPMACRDVDWVRPASGGDLRRLLTERAIQASGGRFATAIATAAPPASDAATPPVPVSVPASGLVWPDDAVRLGSNAYALGGGLTADGGGLLLGNPHFPWQGNSRFFQMHLTLPGRLDVMGAALPPFPVPVIGFNRDVAWSHTVSGSQRFVLHELPLVPGDPLSYLVDGRRERMQPVTVTVPTAGAAPVTRTVYDTRFGMVVTMPGRGLAWTGRIAYALADPERHDTRLVEQWLRLATAASVGEIDRALADVRGTPWINTLAADRQGDALYADMTGVPAVSDDLAVRCAPSAAGAAIARAARLVVLAGDRAACQVVDRNGDRPDHGLMPADRMPRRMTRGLVFNSNDSHWLADPAAPLAGYARIIGPEAVPQRLRTRMGKRRLDEIVAATGGRVAPADLEAMLFDNRNLAAELVVDAMLSVCRVERGGPGERRGRSGIRLRRPGRLGPEQQPRQPGCCAVPRGVAPGTGDRRAVGGGL
ncbi:penicillin acylase family protein [Tistrella bauzanensis]